MTGETVNLSAKPRASTRTKNRVREHLGLFTFLRDAEVPTMLRMGNSGRRSLYLQCQCGTHKEPWLGWLPFDEVTILDVPQEWR